MYTKWLVAVFVSIGLALVSSQSNVTTVTNGNTTDVELSPNVTTTLAPTNITTASPTTPLPTTTSKPTAQPSPPPIPKPESWNGTVSDQNKTCINVQFSVQIDISYNTTNNTQFLTGFTIPSDASVDHLNSHCSQNDSEPQTLAITFANEEHTSANLTLVFNNTDHEVRVQTVKLSFNLTEDLFPLFHDPKLYGTIVTFEKTDLSLFKVASAHSYVCKAPQSADLGSHETGINDVKMDFIDSKVEAYIGESNKGKFDSEIDCKSTEISDVVPIAVGAALAGLVVIVLIAYFIGRRRSRRLAYQSV